VGLREEYRRYGVFIFDGDGVLWRGEKPIQSGIRAVRKLQKAGKIVVLLTNNSTRSRRDYKSKLQKFGVDLPLRNIYTSSYGAALYLKEKGIHRVYVVGEQGLKEEIRGVGAKITWKAECVVAGLDRRFNYNKLSIALRLISSGACFIATNRDTTLPTEQGLLPGAGSIIAAIETASGSRANVTIGKPEIYLLEMISKDFDVDKEEIIMIGDRLDTDIEAASNFGCSSILVLTGVHGLDNLRDSYVKPTFVLNNLDDLFES